MPMLVLKVDVDTYRGTREGVSRLMQILQQHSANASFLFSLGPDHTGRALRRVLRPGFFSKVSRTSVLEHYGLRTLLYGTLLPGPDIGLRCQSEMQAVQQAGFECGIHTWDHVEWQDQVRSQDAQWTQQQMQSAVKRFTDIFGKPASTHGAAGWQMNPHAYTQLDAIGLAYASDGRLALNPDGSQSDPSHGPHRLSVFGKPLQCIQIPTSLPTLDELIGRQINHRLIHANEVAQQLLSLTCPKRGLYQNHVYTLHAELEGQKLAPVFASLLQGWRSQGYQLVCLRQLYESLEIEKLPVRTIQWGELPGRSGQVIMS